MIGNTILHYKISAKLGEGGMGVVYKAEDTKLKRDVAIKFLPRQIAASEEERERFKIEAQAAASLNHANIAHVYAIEEHDDETCQVPGNVFIVMEYIEGRELREMVRDNLSKVSNLRKVLEIATQIAAGLQAAHKKGVTHRDIKSSNLMVTDNGQVKIMDFGLAKIGGGAQLTKSGMTLGTAAYMSPEQARGEATDHRTDIWAFGVVLYEMLTGELPFKGDYEQAVMYSIVNEDPEPILELRNDIPLNLAQIVAKALQKKVEARYQKTEELIADLKASETPPASKSAPADKRTIPSIAVLPFANMSADPENEFFCDGLTEDITAGLSRFSHLSVVSASAVVGYKTESLDVRRVGKKLGARFVIQGGVRKSAKNIRVNVQLLDTETGTHLWAERFDRDLSASDLFTAQDELTDRIVATIADTYGVLTRSLVAVVMAKPIDDLTADECVLRMFGFYQRPRPDEHAKLRRALELAIEREPNHADARACLAITYLDEFRFDFNPREVPLDRALREAQRAVELDATSQLAHRAVAEVHYHRRELSAFRPAADRVLALNPRDTSNVAMAGILIQLAGDWTTGRAVVEKVMTLNPHHAGWLHYTFVHDYYRKREYGKALEAAEKVKLPGYVWSHFWLAVVNAQLGRKEAARKQLKMLLELAPDFGLKARSELSKWFFSEEFVEHLLDGLKKAGLDIKESVGAVSIGANKKRPVQQDKHTKQGKGKK